MLLNDFRSGCIDWTLVESDIVQKFVAGQKWSHLEKDSSKVLTPLNLLSYPPTTGKMAGKESERTPTPVDKSVLESASILNSLRTQPEIESDNLISKPISKVATATTTLL